MTTSVSVSVRSGDDPFDLAVLGALVGTEQLLHLGDITLPATVTGVNLGSGSGYYAHFSFELADDLTFDPAVLTAPTQPPTVHRGRFRRR